MKYHHICYEHNLGLHDMLVSDDEFADANRKAADFLYLDATNIVVREVEITADHALPDIIAGYTLTALGDKTMSRPKAREQLNEILETVNDLIASSQAGGAKEYSFDLHIDTTVLTQVHEHLDSLLYTIDTEFPGA